MKTLISTLLVIPLFAQAQIFSTNYELVRSDKKNRSLYVNTRGTDDDLREIMNMMSASTTHAWGTQMSMNSGSLFHRNPLETDGKVTQTLRALAIFDYYLTHEVRQKVYNSNFWNPTYVDWVGARSTRLYLDDQQKMDDRLRQMGVHQAFDYVAPIFNGSVRKLPDDYKTNPEFIAEIHSSMEKQIKSRFPSPREGMEFGIAENLNYLANSYVPLMVNGSIELQPKDSGKSSKLQIVTMLPRIGELVTPENTLPNEWDIKPIIQPQNIDNGPVNIYEVSLGKYRPRHRPQNFGIKVTIDKDFSKPLEMLMTLEFGQVKTGSSSVLGGMDFSEVEEGLVARGRFKDGSGRMVRIGFQKLVLRLTRPNKSDEETFDRNFKFKFEVEKGKSVKTLALDVPTSGRAARVRSWFRSWVNARSCDYEVNICSYEMGNTTLGQLSAWVMGFVNEEADGSVERMIPQAILDADKSLDKSIASLLQQIDYGVGRLENALVGMKGINFNELPK